MMLAGYRICVLPTAEPRTLPGDTAVKSDPINVRTTGSLRRFPADPDFVVGPIGLQHEKPTTL